MAGETSCYIYDSKWQGCMISNYTGSLTLEQWVKQPDHTSRNEAVMPDEVTAPLTAYMQCARWGENLLPHPRGWKPAGIVTIT